MINYYIISKADEREMKIQKNEEEIIRLMRLQEDYRYFGYKQEANALTSKITMLETQQRRMYAKA